MRNKGVQQWSYKNHQTINKLITNKMKKTLFFLFIFISANAQNKRTINLEIAGTLFSKINTEINNISDITLTGNINNEDIIVLRNMVQNGSLEYVDMFDSYIHIIKGNTFVVNSVLVIFLNVFEFTPIF